MRESLLERVSCFVYSASCCLQMSEPSRPLRYSVTSSIWDTTNSTCVLTPLYHCSVGYTDSACKTHMVLRSTSRLPWKTRRRWYGREHPLVVEECLADILADTCADTAGVVKSDMLRFLQRLAVELYRHTVHVKDQDMKRCSPHRHVFRRRHAASQAPWSNLDLRESYRSLDLKELTFVQETSDPLGLQVQTPLPPLH